MNIIQSISTCFRKYADFSGRASRSEFWWFMVFAFFVFGVSNGIDDEILIATKTNIVSFSVGVLMFWPITAVSIRRLHDVGISGSSALKFFAVTAVMLLLVFAIPYLPFEGATVVLAISILVILGIIVVLFLYIIAMHHMMADSHPHPNQYGDCPKQIEDRATH